MLQYSGPGESLVRGLKFHGLRCLLGDVGRILHGRLDVLDMLRGAVLVPVPLHAVRQRERGYNQSLWLAQVFANEAGASCRELLVRTRDTGTQTALGREERLKNMRGAFALRQAVKIHPQQSYVLVDDVITTGATLDACASALLRAGAASPAVLTLAHA